MKVILYDGTEWYIDPKLKKELDIMIDDVIFHQMDLFIILDGEEGSGKSYGGRGLGKYIATRLRENNIMKSFTPKNIHFRQKEYITSSKDGDKFDILLLDEGRASLGRSRSKDTLEAVGWVSRCRFMHQFHIICVPAYHDLNPYLSEWRSRAVIHFKKSYSKKADGSYSMRHGEYKLYCDLEGLRFHSRFRDYKYPNNHDAWSYWSAREVFSGVELDHYNQKKEFYARLTEDDETKDFVFSENTKNSFSDGAAGLYPTTNESGRDNINEVDD